MRAHRSRHTARKVLQGYNTAVALREKTNIPHGGQTTTEIIYMLTCSCEMWCRICTVQTQPRKHFATLDHAEYTAPIRQHDELDDTGQGSICPARSRSSSRVQIQPRKRVQDHTEYTVPIR